MTRLALSSLLTLLLLSNPARAIQVLDASDDKPLIANISQREMSRIAIDKGRVRKLPFAEGELIVEKDEENGQVFVRPAIEGTTKSINVFVIDDRGRTYVLLLQPSDIPAENIIIRDRATKSEKSSIEKSGSYQRVIKNMVLAMATDASPNGVEVREMRQEIPLWQEAKLLLQRIYIGRSVIGEKFILANVSEKPMVIAEPELSRRGVISVSVENMNLAPGESTNVFVVREKKDNE